MQRKFSRAYKYMTAVRNLERRNAKRVQIKLTAHKRHEIPVNLPPEFSSHLGIQFHVGIRELGGNVDICRLDCHRARVRAFFRVFTAGIHGGGTDSGGRSKAKVIRRRAIFKVGVP